MRKTVAIICCMFAFAACDKHDPILPGVRTAIFNTSHIDVKNQTISDIPTSVATVDNTNCPYTQDGSNTIGTGRAKSFLDFQQIIPSKMICARYAVANICMQDYLRAKL